MYNSDNTINDNKQSSSGTSAEINNVVNPSQADTQNHRQDEIIALDIPQRRFLTFLCALACLLIAMTLIGGMIAVFVVPVHNITDAELVLLKIIVLLVGILYGGLFLIISIDMFAKLRYKYIIRINNDCIEANGNIFSRGFISWSDISDIKSTTEHYKRHAGRYLAVWFKNATEYTSKFSFIWHLCLTVLYGRSSGPMKVKVGLTLCKGGANLNADKIVNAWRQKTRPNKA